GDVPVACFVVVEPAHVDAVLLGHVVDEAHGVITGSSPERDLAALAAPTEGNEKSPLAGFPCLEPLSAHVWAGRAPHRPFFPLRPLRLSSARFARGGLRCAFRSLVGASLRLARAGS